MTIFDAHCDTMGKILDYQASLYSNKFHCDITRMQEYTAFSQIFAAFVPPKYTGQAAFSRANAMLDAFDTEAASYAQHITVCRSYTELSEAWQNHQIAALLSLEGGSPLCGSLEHLQYFYNRGVRLITLTWNHRNELGCGAVSAEEGEGLTPFGFAVVEKMNALGMIIDVSHLSDAGFYDVCNASRQPFVASHSNARNLCDHKRNLTDAMILALIEREGVIGINLYPDFICKTGSATIDQVIDHIEHIAGLGGQHAIGLGCDFDGIDKTPAGIETVSDLSKLINRLLQLNYTSAFIQQFTHQNFINLIKKIL